MSRPAELTGSDTVTDLEPIDVIVGILIDAAGRVLIAERPDGKHMAGAWEFPGGKFAPGETPYAALGRELAEELGIRVDAAEPFFRHEFRYPDRHVRLDVWWVLGFSGAAEGSEGQRIRWCEPEALAEAPMLPADRPLVAAVLERLGT